MRSLRYLFFSLLCPVTIAFSQSESHQRETIYFDQSQDTATIYMNGLLDENNTFTYPNFKAFQPMKKLTISNVGSGIVQYPRLTINFKKNWFDINSLRTECFQGTSSVKEKALAVWKFMRDNRLHYFEPDWGQEIDDPIKLLGVYGYGMCYNTSFVTASIASNLSKVGLPYMEYSPRNRHSVKDIRFDSTFVLLDSDIEVFYLNNDNERLATYDEIANDKYLIRRVHHYGKHYEYNSQNNFVAYAVYEPTPAVNYAGLYHNYHTLDFQLRPGESLEYNWGPGKYYHHNVTWETHNVPPGDFANGKFIYRTNFINAPLDDIVNGHSRVETVSTDDIKPNIHPAAVNDTSSFVIKVTSPFVIVNGMIKGRFYRESVNDQLKVFFSKDSIAWKSVWESAQVGLHNDSIDLHEKIQPIGAPAVYHYYVKVEMLSNNSEQSCGVDSLQIISDFQVSRFFLPSLQLGKNLISYSDNSLSRDVAVKIEWNETFENHPPPRIESPIFPVDQSVVDSLKFTFQWEAVADPDGIIDYEFMLSDREDMRFPLSPSFEVYTSKLDNQSLRSFSLPFDGMLNANTKYYWKVRAKDLKGAWGEWSPVWSFTPNGPMPPTMNQSKVYRDSVVLSWKENEKGSMPQHYEIHASNEAFGFTPGQSTLLGTTVSTTKAIRIGNTFQHETDANNETSDSTPEEIEDTSESPRILIEDLLPKTFYRIVAVDDKGSKSGPSNYSMLPYPYVYNQPDSIRPDYADTLIYKLKTNAVYVIDMELLPMSNIAIHDSVQINILSKPNWVTYNESDRTLSGVPNYIEAHRDSVIVEFRGINTGYKNIQVFKAPVRPNSKPSFGEMDSVAHLWSMFNQTITVSDPDLELGDYIGKVEVVAKPSWLEVEFNKLDRTVLVLGIPKAKNLIDTVLTLKAFDAIGDSVLKTFNIKVGVPEQFKSDESGIMTVTPNPFEDKISVLYRLIRPGNVKVLIFNSGAQKIYDASLGDKPPGIYDLTWDSSGHHSGLYYFIIEIETENTTHVSSQKIIKL